MNTPPPACPTGKRRYDSENRAQRILRAIWRDCHPGRRLENRTYRCGHCAGWHLTSKARRP